jgi:hypothetical protein
MRSTLCAHHSSDRTPVAASAEFGGADPRSQCQALPRARRRLQTAAGFFGIDQLILEMSA